MDSADGEEAESERDEESKKVASLLNKLKPAKLSKLARAGKQKKNNFLFPLCLRMQPFVLDAKKNLDFKQKFVRISGNYRYISACLKELRESMMGDFSSIFARCLDQTG